MRKSFGILSKSMILDQFRQDFAGVTQKIRENLGIKLPNALCWVIAGILQLTLLFLFAIFLESISHEKIRNIIIFFVLLFNVLLPRVMARQNSSRVSNHPIQELLWQSGRNGHQLLNVVLVTETIMFWIHEFMFEAIAIYAILKSPLHWASSLLLIALWILLVSTIYYTTLKRSVLRNWGVTAMPAFHQNFPLYILKVVCLTVPIYFISKLLFSALINHPIPAERLGQGLGAVLREFSANIKATITSRFNHILDWFQYEWIYIILAASLVVYAIFTLGYLYYSSKLSFHRKRLSPQLDNTRSLYFKFYHGIVNMLWRKNPWLSRDLWIMERTIGQTKLPQKFILVFPPAISSIVGLSFFLIYGLESFTNFVLAFWFICCFALYQTAWLWVWNYPILHPSSELRQIDLVKLSAEYSVQKYMRSKTMLLLVLLVPLQLIMNLILVVGAIKLKGSLLEIIVGIIGTWLLFVMIGIMSSYWLKYCSRFDYANMFLIRMDTYETRIVQQFYTIPKRFITGAMFVLFFVAVFFETSVGQKLVYDAFLVFVIVTGFTLYFFFKNKKGKRASLVSE
ncbi:hypothetical protein MKX50_25305 [Paenibacillus sp. FSL W8-0186]|uniref:hypothetical protein n=1 Tax=Paenibacillus TaxID=44249 RepID=UPI001BCC9927|nr:hypothetical protein [Paenibacillus woosongensis]